MYWYPPPSSAFWYGGTALSNEALSDEMDESRLLMPAGMFFVVYLYFYRYCFVITRSQGILLTRIFVTIFIYF